MLKVQDTVPINACQFSQRLALIALGKEDVAKNIATLEQNRAYVWDALEPLRQAGENIVHTQGSLYMFAKLPDGVDDMEALKHLAKELKIGVLPGKGPLFKFSASVACICSSRKRI